jgi:hypothetical protein
MIGPEKTKEGAMNISPPNEHRGLVRLPGDTVGPLLLRGEPKAPSFSADVRDVSIQGIGLIAQQSFVSGTSFAIDAGPSGRSLPMELTVQVRHATMLADGRWLLGCSFSRPLTADDFEVLG